MARKILFIIIDQLRADCLNGAMSGALDMPHLRALMKESVTFNRHFSTIVPCGPSRASLFTGLYAMNHRSIHNGTPLSNAHPTIGTSMRRAGYDPLLFGYSDGCADPQGLHPNDPLLADEEGLSPGFTEIVRMRFQENHSWLGYLKSKGYDLPAEYSDVFKGVASDPGKPPKITDPALYSKEDSDTAYLTDRTILELSVREKTDWFSTVTYIRPHPPFVAPSPYNTMYDPAKCPAPNRPNSVEQMKAEHPFFNAHFSKPTTPSLYIGFDGMIADLSDEQIAQLRAVYYGLVTEVDHHIGRLIQFLRDTDQYDDTLIVVTADHGEMLGEQNLWGKTTHYNGSFHVPLIIRDPRRQKSAGRQVEAFTESIDIAPTLLEWVGLDNEPGFNGKSLIPWLEGETPKDWRSHMFAEMDMSDSMYGIRYFEEFGVEPHECNLAILQDDNFKLVHFNGGVKPLLYDIKNDPHEANNLAQDPAHIGDLLTMSRKMLDHRMTHAHHALSRMLLTREGLVNI